MTGKRGPDSTTGSPSSHPSLNHSDHHPPKGKIQALANTEQELQQTQQKLQAVEAESKEQHQMIQQLHETLERLRGELAR